MAIVLTGRNLTMEIAGVAYSAQVSRVAIVPSNSVSQAKTLTTSIPYNMGTTFALEIDGFQDWGEAVSLCDALWSAAATGTAVTFEMVADGPTADRTWTGSIIPVYVTAGGSAEEALSFSQSFEIVGIPTKV